MSNQWIDVNEKLPDILLDDYSDIVVVCGTSKHGKFKSTARLWRDIYINNETTWNIHNDSIISPVVTHWIPIPDYPF